MSALLSLAQVTALAALAPLLPGIVQTLKARLQGRRGPSPWQPYRELRRLWGKSSVAPIAATAVYRAAPPVVAAALAICLAIVVLPGVTLPSAVGHDAIALVGLIALARFALAAAAWDTGSGFALMGAARDLTFGILVDALLVLCIALAALPAASTDLAAMSAAAAGVATWASPAHWCAAVAFALVVVAETGRQPVDNPDTHLELTMIHEGPLLEYAGRDLALLQWAAAARHALLLLLAVTLFLPHYGSGLGDVIAGLVELLIALAALALTESLVAKMRILRFRVFAGAGVLVAVAGLAAWYAGIGQ